MDHSESILSDNKEDFVLLNDALLEAIYDIRYYSDYNFVGRRIKGYEKPLAYLTKEAFIRLKNVADELNEKGYLLKIYDAYRPVEAVLDFMDWASNDDEKMKEYFYPFLDKKDILPLGYLKRYSGHSRGSTIDLTIVDKKSLKDLDMGGTFDYFGDISHPFYEGISDTQKDNRMLLRETMMKYGFVPSKVEWWHFTLDDEPYKNTYFTFPIDD